PTSTEYNDTTLHPVIYFIHGESYDAGSGNAYDATVLAAVGNVVVITINYRLGILGFLTLENSAARGNNGILDLLAGLDWVNKNIRNFGGDPNNVCLFGHRYGAALVNLLIMSPVLKSRNLFRNAIMQSGSALASWGLSHYPIFYAHQLLNRFNC
ncbi:hypothetical protein HELRODRAFT_142616, partial [Helobdella robusta]|uniref:Carboxylesterase type B domain-containing protein n=1 Tax=Helobdella robusta TaxID=6412 RepID=T1EJ63_HELRO